MKSCNICGSFVAKLQKHLGWHETKGDKIQTRERKTNGFCTDCGTAIEFRDGGWKHANSDKNCTWRRGTDKRFWSHCGKCGQKMTDSHSCGEK